jgi:hypothetical protein
MITYHPYAAHVQFNLLELVSQNTFRRTLFLFIKKDVTRVMLNCVLRAQVKELKIELIINFAFLFKKIIINFVLKR